MFDTNVTSVLHWLLDVVLQATLLLCCANVSLLVLKRASAAWRHLVWAMTVVGLLLLPFLNTVVPQRQVLTSTISTPSNSWLWRLSAASSKDAAAQARPVAANPVEEVASAPSAFDSPQSTLMWSQVWRMGLWSLWLLGVVVCGLRVVLGLCALRGLERRSIALETGPLLQQMSKASEALRLRRPVTLRLALSEADIAVPLTWGWRHPIVLLPANAQSWPQSQCRAVLLHELAHIARGDWATQLAAQAMCVFYWFHPLAWLAARNMSAQSERATDDRVLSLGVRASEYGECLLNFTRLLQATQENKIMKLGLPLAHRSTFEKRLSALLDTGRNRRGVSRPSLVCALGFMAVVVTALATVRATNQTPAMAAGMAVVPASSTRTANLSSPEAALRSFIAALNRYDAKGAAACVEGGKVTKRLDGFSEPAKQFKVSYAVEGVRILRLNSKRDEAILNVARFTMKQYVAAAPPEYRNMVQASKMQKVMLRRRAGVWKLVPPATLTRAEVDSSLPAYIAVFATTKAIEDTQRAKVQEDVCRDSVRWLGMGAMQPIMNNQRIHLKTAFEKTLSDAIRKQVIGGDIEPEKFFRCPADKSGKISYSFNENLEGMNQQDIDKIPDSLRVVMFYEGHNKKLDFRHNGRAAVGYLSGTSELVTREQAKNLRWK